MKKLLIAAIVLMLAQVAGGYTYTRDAGTTCTQIVDVVNGSTRVCPGDSVQTYKVLSTGWTQTAATPYYTPTISTETVTAVGAESQTVDIDEDTAESIMISDVTEGITVSVFYNSAANTPAAWVATSVSPFITDVKLRNGAPKFGQLVLTFSGAGSCTVSAYREEIKQ